MKFLSVHSRVLDKREVIACLYQKEELLLPMAEKTGIIYAIPPQCYERLKGILTELICWYQKILNSVGIAWDRLVQVGFERIGMNRSATAKVNSSDVAI